MLYIASNDKNLERTSKGEVLILQTLCIIWPLLLLTVAFIYVRDSVDNTITKRANKIYYSLAGDWTKITIKEANFMIKAHNINASNPNRGFHLPPNIKKQIENFLTTAALEATILKSDTNK